MLSTIIFDIATPLDVFVTAAERCARSETEAGA
jgi:hypothetical protein